MRVEDHLPLPVVLPGVDFPPCPRHGAQTHREKYYDALGNSSAVATNATIPTELAGSMVRAHGKKNSRLHAPHSTVSIDELPKHVGG